MATTWAKVKSTGVIFDAAGCTILVERAYCPHRTIEIDDLRPKHGESSTQSAGSRGTTGEISSVQGVNIEPPVANTWSWIM